MRIKFVVLRLAILSVMHLAIAHAGFGADLTAKELIKLMKASSQRYVDITANITATAYKEIEGEPEPEVQRITKIITRRTKDRTFWKIDVTLYPSSWYPNINKQYRESKTFAFHPNYTKRLLEEPNRAPSGLIRSGGITHTGLDRGFYSIYWVLWGDAMELLWWEKKPRLHETKLHYDKNDNIYILSVQIASEKGPIWEFYVDPDKNFIPIKTEWFRADGTLLKRVKCDEFQQVNHLWIPVKYCWSDPARSEYSEYYEVEKFTVNEPIDPNLLDFSFPAGTIVRDEIAGLKYRIEKEGAILNDDSLENPYSIENVISKIEVNEESEPNILTDDTIEEPKLPEDRQLSEAAREAQNIAQSLPRKNTSKASYFWSIALAGASVVFLAIMTLLIIKIRNEK